MTNANYLQTLADLGQGAVVITPNNRLARTLLQDYLKSAQQTVLEKPACYSYDEFINQLYFKLNHHHPHIKHPILLSPQQTQLLWTQLLKTEQELAHQGLLHRAYEAFSRCLLWQIDLQHTQFSLTTQTEQFQKWATSFLTKLQRLNAMTPEMIVPYLIQQSSTCLDSQQFIWFCFDEYTPEQEALQRHIERHGGLNQYRDLTAIDSQPFVLETSDDHQELLILIHYLKDQLKEQQRVGVVIPDLNQKASAINRLLQQHFSANQFNISLGKTLADYSLVAHALCWLTLNEQTISQEEAALLLNSPYLTYSKQELLARAQLMQDSPLLEERIIERKRFINELATFAPELATTLSTLLPYPKHASPNDWATLFQTRLAALGFPGEYPLDSTNYQCYQRFLILFDEFKQLSFCVPNMSLSDALFHFTQLAKQTIFQPEKDSTAPIQILGLLEAAGRQFDTLWIMGMTSECLPKKTHFAPFIPVNLQREHQLPYTSPEKEFNLAEITLTRFKHAASQIIFSYARHTNNQSHHVTPLLTQLPLYNELDPPDFLPLRQALDSSAQSIYSQQLGFRQGACERVEGVYMEYMTDDEQACNAAENSIAQSIQQESCVNTDAVKQQKNLLQHYQDPTQLPQHQQQAHSASTAILANQAKCPFRAFANHRLNVKRKKEVSDGLNALERGTVIHRIMELFWRHVETQRTLLTLNEETLTALIQNCIEAALAPYRSKRPYSFSTIVQQVEKKRLHRLVDALLVWEKSRPEFCVSQVETNYALTLANLHFDVRIDRLDSVGLHEKWVIDYKTTLPQKTPWREDRPTEPQILLYALLDEHINALLFVELKKGQIACKGLSEEPHQLTGLKRLEKEESWQAVRQHWNQQLEQLAQEFQDGVCAPKPITPSTCEQCDFPNLCRLPLQDDTQADIN